MYVLANAVFGLMYTAPPESRACAIVKSLPLIDMVEFNKASATSETPPPDDDEH